MNNPQQPDTEPQQPNHDDAEQASDITPAPSAPARSARIGTTLVLLLLLAAATGYGGWWLWQQQQTMMTTHIEQFGRLSTQYSNVNDQLQGVSQSLNTLQRHQAELEATIATLQTEVVTMAQQQDAASNDSDDLLTEVEFLLRSARHIGLLTGDLDRVEHLLEHANQQLQAAQRLALLPIREALNQDLQQLRSLPRTDFDELYLQLGALAHDSQQWQWWPASRLHDASEPVTALATTGWQAAWLELRSLVQLHERTEQRFETLDAVSFEQARNQYRLFLLQAQAALLQGQQQAYQASLEQAKVWLDRFQEYIPQHELLQAQLQALMAASVIRQTPDINRALERLQQFQQAQSDAGAGS